MLSLVLFNTSQFATPIVLPLLVSGNCLASGIPGSECLTGPGLLRTLFYYTLVAVDRRLLISIPDAGDGSCLVPTRSEIIAHHRSIKSELPSCNLGGRALRSAASPTTNPILLISHAVVNAKHLYTNQYSPTGLSLSFVNLMPVPLDFCDGLWKLKSLIHQEFRLF